MNNSGRIVDRSMQKYGSCTVHPSPKPHIFPLLPFPSLRPIASIDLDDEVMILRVVRQRQWRKITSGVLEASPEIFGHFLPHGARVFRQRDHRLVQRGGGLESTVADATTTTHTAVAH